MTNIYVVGGGGHAKVVIGTLKKLKKYRIPGYTDHRNRNDILGVPYLGTDEILIGKLNNSKKVHIAIGVGKLTSDSTRSDIINRLEKYKFIFPVIISPDAVVNEDTDIKQGSVVFDGAIINPGTVIGNWGIINTNATIEHDCNIGTRVHVAPGAILCGGVCVGDNTLIGAGSVVKQYVSITSRCIIGAGSVVVKDIAEPGTYFGSPARRMDN
jgi:sugar O-acyltransferase (sialic acid O-acetyltransferase NeuD family)